MGPAASAKNADRLESQVRFADLNEAAGAADAARALTERDSEALEL